LYIHYPEMLSEYDLTRLVELDQYVARALNIDIPFNMPITSAYAFAHKAGVHTKAVLRNPRAYEILDPGDFGLARSIQVGSRLTGRYAVGHRASTLGFQLSGDEIIHLTQALKERAEAGSLSQDEVDTFIRKFFQPPTGQRPPQPPQRGSIHTKSS